MSRTQRLKPLMTAYRLGGFWRAKELLRSWRAELSERQYQRLDHILCADHFMEVRRAIAKSTGFVRVVQVAPQPVDWIEITMQVDPGRGRHVSHRTRARRRRRKASGPPVPRMRLIRVAFRLGGWLAAREVVSSWTDISYERRAFYRRVITTMEGITNLRTGGTPGLGDTATLSKLVQAGRAGAKP